MNIFVVTLAVVGISIAFLAVGVIFSNKNLKGSCGGLGKVMGKCGKCECKKEKIV